MAKKEKKTTLFTLSGSNENWVDGSNEGQGQGGGGYQNAPQRNREDRRDRGDRGDRDQGWRDDRQGGGRRFQDERYQGPRDNFRNRDREFRERDGEDGRHKFSNADDTRGRYPPRRFGGEEQNTQIDFGRKDIKDNLPDQKPFLVVISNFPPGTDDVELAEHFEEKGCKIENMEMPNGVGKEPAIMELEDKESLKTALDLTRTVYKDYSLLIELKTEDKDKSASGQQRANIGSDREGNKQYNSGRGQDRFDRDGYRGGGQHSDRYDRRDDRQDRGQDRGYRSGDNRGDSYRGGDRNSYSSYSTSDRGDKKPEQKKIEDGISSAEKSTEKKPKMNFTVDIEVSKKKQNPFGDAQPVNTPTIVDDIAKKPLQEQPQLPK